MMAAPGVTRHPAQNFSAPALLFPGYRLRMPATTYDREPLA